jgi:hypothetical protein
MRVKNWTDYEKTEIVVFRLKTIFGCELLTRLIEI